MKEIELLKTIFKDSPVILEPLNEIDKEIERLNNIIKELEKWLDGYLKSIAIHNKIPESDEYALKEVIDKVKELKGDSSN